MRILTLATAGIISVRAFAADTPLEIKVTSLDAPASLGTAPFSLTHGANGETYLAWSDQQQRLEITSFDSVALAWRRVSRGPEMFSPGRPTVSASASGRLTSAWSLTGGLRTANPRAAASAQSLAPVVYGVYVESKDGGLSWSASTRFSDEFARIDWVSVAAMSEKATVLAWRDSRDSSPATPARTRIYAQVVVPGEPEDPTEFAPRFLRQIASGDGLGNPIALGFEDGSALIAYPINGAELRFARFENGKWSPPVVEELLPPLDGASSPAAIAKNGPRIAILRRTAAGALDVAFSTDAGHRFDTLATVTGMSGSAISNANATVLRDGSVIVVAIDTRGTFVRRVSAGGAMSAATKLFDPEVPGGVQLSVVSDDGQGATRLIAAMINSDAPIFRLLTLSEPAVLAAADADCGCGPSLEELVGYPIRVRILKVDAAAGTVSVDQTGVAGVFPADTRTLKVSDDLAKTLRPGQQALARVEDRDGTWWLYAVRLLGAELR